MRAHAITTTARVGGRRRPKRAIVPCGILTLSLAVVLLAATASTASATVTLAPTSFDFGDRQVGTTSPMGSFRLTVSCYGNGCPTTFAPSIAVSGDYAQTNNCAPTLSANQVVTNLRCFINVTFTPTSTGPKSGTLSTGPGGPTATLTGNGVTHATPPALPLLLTRLWYGTTAQSKTAELRKKKIEVVVATNNDSTVVARGGVKKTVVQTAAGKPTRFKAKVKHLGRLEQSPKPMVKIRFAATDEFGQTATDELKVRLCMETRHGYCVRAAGNRHQSLASRKTRFQAHDQGRSTVRATGPTRRTPGTSGRVNPDKEES
jgi:hypothetical protein